MEPHEKTIHSCLFCQKVTLEVLTWPGYTAVRSVGSAGQSTTYRKTPDGFELINEKCSDCGKNANEIKRAWKESAGIADERKKKKRLEELKKRGYSGTITSL